MAETETGTALGSNAFDGLELGGAPRKDSAINTGGGIGGIDQINPGSLGDGGGNPGDGETPRKRGRPKGWRKDGSAPTKSNPVTVDGLESILLSLHAMAALALKQPALNLDPKEAALLAKSVKAVQDQYPVTKIDAKIAVLIQLGGAIGIVYGPRVVAIRMMRMQQPRVYQQQAPAAAPAVDTPAHVDNTPMVEKIDPATGLSFMVPAPGPITA